MNGPEPMSSPPSQRPLGSTVLMALLPLALLGLVLWGIVALRPVERIRGADFPPVEELSVERTILPRPGMIELRVVNVGASPVTLSQVTVDQAYWSHVIDAGRGRSDDPALASMEPEAREAEEIARRTLPRLGRARVWIDYPWVQGEAHEVALVTRTGLTFVSPINVAVESPRPDAAQFGLFAMLGVLVGVVPVSLGLLWYPMVRRLGPAGVALVLCFTLGLLVFLAVDALAEAIEVAGDLPGVYKGVGLIVLGFGFSVLVLTVAERWFSLRKRGAGEPVTGLGLAYLIAGGIGLHNLSEGLAIGAAFNLGEIALGATLIIGFTVHNLTEGLAIVAPLSRVRPGLGHFIWLGVLAGGPTILGGWIGAFSYSKVWALLFLAMGAGAIVQVTITILRQMARGSSMGRVLSSTPNAASLALGYAAMYLTGLLVAV